MKGAELLLFLTLICAVLISKVNVESTAFKKT